MLAWNVILKLKLCDLSARTAREDQLVIPEESQPIVVQLAHDGHLGLDKIFGLMRESTWFPEWRGPTKLSSH